MKLRIQFYIGYTKLSVYVWDFWTGHISMLNIKTFDLSTYEFVPTAMRFITVSRLFNSGDTCAKNICILFFTKSKPYEFMSNENNNAKMTCPFSV